MEHIPFDHATESFRHGSRHLRLFLDISFCACVSKVSDAEMEKVIGVLSRKKLMAGLVRKPQWCVGVLERHSCGGVFNPVDVWDKPEGMRLRTPHW